MDQVLTAFWSGALCDKVFVTQSPTVAIVGGLIQLELAGNMDKQLWYFNIIQLLRFELFCLLVPLLSCRVGLVLLKPIEQNKFKMVFWISKWTSESNVRTKFNLYDMPWIVWPKLLLCLAYQKTGFGGHKYTEYWYQESHLYTFNNWTVTSVCKVLIIGV